MLLAVLVGQPVSARAGYDSVPDEAGEASPLGKGELFPDSSVKTLNGSAVGLHELIAGKPAVFVFYRGGWCPYCTRHLSALREVIPELNALGVRVFAVSPDRPEKLKETRREQDLNYELVSDSQVNAIRDLGLAFRVADSLVDTYKSEYGIDLEADSGETHHILPVPAVYLVGGDGRILYQYSNPDYRTRLDPKKLLTNIKSEIR